MDTHRRNCPSEEKCGQVYPYVSEANEQLCTEFKRLRSTLPINNRLFYDPTDSDSERVCTLGAQNWRQKHDIGITVPCFWVS